MHAAPPRAPRWLFIDFLRFSAVVLMVQGHTFDALLTPALKAAPWYTMHSFWHGFTAPMFLFASGLAFGIATLRKWPQHLVAGPVLVRRFRRYGLLILIGYFLHLPFFSYQKMMTSATEANFLSFFKSDALHLIGLTLILCQTLVYVLKRPAWVVRVLGALTVLVVLTTPVIWHIPFLESVPLAVAAYLNGMTGSVFPLFPWSAYLFCGVITAYYLEPVGQAAPRPVRIHRTAALGLLLIIGAGALAQVQVNGIFPQPVVWRANPLVFMMRLGTLLLFLVLLFELERRLRQRGRLTAPAGPTLAAVMMMAQETLSIYVLHLVILYGSVVNKGMLSVWGRRLGIVEAILFFLVLFVLLRYFASAWHHIKQHRAGWLRLAQVSATLLFLFYFFTNPF